ncbi:MAG: M23 family metallopeptidase [Myxococcales bacterium]|nr:M23 family metallopeptidase [Myxococcales bacterium]
MMFRDAALSSLPRPALPWALLAVSVILNLVLIVARMPSSPDAPAAQPKPVAAAPKAPPAAAPTAASGGTEWKVVRTVLQGSPSRTFNEAVPEDGDALAAVYSRLFVWDLDLRRDLSPGDEMAVAYRWNEANQIDVAVARLHAKKPGKAVRAYRFQASGDAFSSYWNESGIEIPLRLKNGPLDGYDQITSLLKDRPLHKGMDFKTPVGTDVKVPFAGKVTRANWNWGANGNCIEVQFEDGTLAKFLHLNENLVKPGDTLVAGQVVAKSGNTGHSTAPHLHYQLNQGETVVDPIDYHGTERRTLTDADKGSFAAVVGKLDAMLAPRTAGL